MTHDTMNISIKSSSKGTKYNFVIKNGATINIVDGGSQIVSTNYRNGKKCGVSITKNADSGRVVSCLQYDNDQLHGVCVISHSYSEPRDSTILTYDHGEVRGPAFSNRCWYYNEGGRIRLMTNKEREWFGAELLKLEDLGSIVLPFCG